jgi:predicted O-methyltransferase YrrM
MQEWKKDRILYNIPTEKKLILYNNLIKDIFDSDKEFNDLSNELFSSDFWKELYHEKEVIKNYKTAGPITRYGIDVIYSLIRKTKPRIIIETGISYGFSTAVILFALLKNNDESKLISIEKNVMYYTGSFVQDYLKKNWCVKFGKSYDILPDITDDIDIFLHDSLHTYDNMYFEYTWALNRLKENGFIISDDIGHNNSFFDFTNNNNLKYYLIRTSSHNKKFSIGVMIK